MNKQAIWALAVKDMRAVTSSVQIWLPMVILPVVFCLLMPLGLVLSLRFLSLDALGDIQALLQTMEDLPAGPMRASIMQWESLEQRLLYFTAVYIMTPLFLLIPMMVSSIIAANSFVGEKEGRTLESLLYTPIDLVSLFVGKVLSALLPAVIVTFGCAVLYSLTINLAGAPLMGRWILPQWNWIVMIVYVVPSLSLGAILVNVAISARVKGFQEAYQMGVMVILPVLALFVGQTTGVLLFSIPAMFVVGTLVLLISYWGVRRLARSFDRNRLFASQVR